jgi:hypothetical protein
MVRKIDRIDMDISFELSRLALSLLFCGEGAGASFSCASFSNTRRLKES